MPHDEAGDRPDKPEPRAWAARPLAEPGPAPAHAFHARPVATAYAPWPASVPYERHYPGLALTPAAAAVDLLIIVAASVVAFVVMSNLAAILSRAAPEIGFFWGNTLIGIPTIAVVFGMSAARAQPAKSLGLSVPDKKPVVLGIILGVPACYLATIASGVLYMTIAGESPNSVFEERQAVVDMMPPLSVQSLLLLAVFPGFHEELLFRGFMLPRLCRLLRSKWLAVIVSSVLFGSLHGWQGTMGIVQTGALSVVFAGMAILSRSIWPAIVVHAMFNGTNLFLMTRLMPWMEEFERQLTTSSALAL